MWFYNHDRWNMALGGFTQKQHLAKAANDLLLVSTEYGGLPRNRRILADQMEFLISHVPKTLRPLI